MGLRQQALRSSWKTPRKGNYTVHLDPGFNGSDVAIHIGNSYEGDPGIAKLLRNKGFPPYPLTRHRPGSAQASLLARSGNRRIGGPVARYPSLARAPNGTKICDVLDLKQANELLIKVGLPEKDSEGYRQRLDGKGRLRLEMITVGGHSFPYTQVGEMVKQQWKKIGVDVDVKELERNLAFTRRTTATRTR